MRLLLILFILIGCNNEYRLALPKERQTEKSDIARILKRGHLLCGVSTGLAGFSNKEKNGNWSGLDVDICRALSIALFGQDKSIEYIPLNSNERFDALKSGKVDILSRNTTRTLLREEEMGFAFGPVVFYDGQTVMTRTEDGYFTLDDLDGESICVQKGTSHHTNLKRFFMLIQKKLVVKEFDDYQAMLKAFKAGECKGITADESTLVAEKYSMGDMIDFMIMPEFVSKEPLAPLVRKEDHNLARILKWTVYSLIEAEEMGVTSQNIDTLKNSVDENVRRFLGTVPGNGKLLGLDESWAYQIIKKLGNYAEVYHRNLGDNSPFKLRRGLNRHWTQGGLHFSPAFY